MEEAEQGVILPRLGLVATDEVLIAGLRAVLGEPPGWELVVLSEPGALETARLELVLIDAGATDHLLELVSNFRRLRPRIRLLVLGSFEETRCIEAVIEAGARGVLGYDASAANVRLAVEVVLDGSVWAPRRVLSRLLDRAWERALERSVEAGGSVHLTKREQEVVALLAEGLSNREIAHALSIEEGSVKAHLGRLMRKAGVKSRTALGVHAIAAKWL